MHINERKTSLKQIVACAFLLWLGLATVLGLRKWGCALPWSLSCQLDFFGKFEAVILFTWVRDSETLVAGMLAVTAATVSVIYLKRQIEQTQRHEARRIRLRTH